MGETISISSGITMEKLWGSLRQKVFNCEAMVDVDVYVIGDK